MTSQSIFKCAEPGAKISKISVWFVSCVVRRLTLAKNVSLATCFFPVQDMWRSVTYY